MVLTIPSGIPVAHIVDLNRFCFTSNFCIAPVICTFTVSVLFLSDAEWKNQLCKLLLTDAVNNNSLLKCLNCFCVVKILGDKILPTPIQSLSFKALVNLFLVNFQHKLDVSNKKILHERTSNNMEWLYLSLSRVINVTGNHVQAALAIRGFDYSRTQKLRITRGNGYFRPKLA